MLDIELADELMTGFDDHYEIIQSTLEALANKVDDGLLNELFRSVHTIKGNAAMVECQPIVDYTHALEETISAMRAHKFLPTPTICDVILMAIDRLRDIHETQFFDKKFDPLDEAGVTEAFTYMSQTASSEEAEKHCKVLITLFTPSLEEIGQKAVVDDIPAALPISSSDCGNQLDVSNFNTHDFLNADDSQKKDLQVLRSLALQVDQRGEFCQGRTDRIIYLALEMAKRATQEIDTIQLVGGIYGHDIGMAFVPDAILNKDEKLTKTELNLMKKHVSWGYEILSRFSGWGLAATIVLQHHERDDGQGYPNQLDHSSLAPESQIITILDAYYAMSHERTYRPHRRSVLRSVSEINACSGTQFNGAWVDVFNDVIRDEVRSGNI